MAARKLGVQTAGRVMAGETGESLARETHQRSAGGRTVIGAAEGGGDRLTGEVIGGGTHREASARCAAQ